MVLLGDQYASSDEDSSKPVPRDETAIAATPVVAAPDVSLDVWSHSNHDHPASTNVMQDPMRLSLMLAKPTDNSLTYNVPFEDLARPAQGPLNPYKSTTGNALKRKSALTGDASEASFSEATFRTQHRTFQSLGYANDPSVNGAYVGDLTKAQAFEGKDIVQMRPSKEDSAAFRQKRQRKGDASIIEGEGAYRGPWAKYQNDQMYEDEAALGDEELASDEEYLEEAIVPAKSSVVGKLASDYQSDLSATETSKLEGTLYDYQGRTFLSIPQDQGIDLKQEPGTQKNYIPKKLKHTWKSHTKAINALRFFPGSGHLLLSASADTTVKLWDVYRNKSELLRTYSGHLKSVTDTTFSNDGKQFLTGSFDRYIKLWDTETGACISRFQTSSKAVPHVLRFYPSTDTNEFLVGTSDKKIVQFDIRSGKMAQEYDHHLQAVNTITFVDENRRFITTSDDKSLRAWEYNIPVPIKYIAEPYMYSLVRAAPHPNGKSVAFQSADNQVVVYASTDRFRQNRKKSFRGHNTAGYAIDLSISPDGQFLMSGDSGGYLCFWDWKSCKMFPQLKAHDGPVICAQWHPQETSRVATGGLDGAIKYWD
ncbi:MAG: hypothetical protein Q9208_006557 [Pyrenodesmia sp. 3 TL-2023]